MKAVLLALGLAVVAALWPPARPAPVRAEPVRLVVAGGFDGYLSPCGCVKPMTGGIRRMATALESLRLRGEVVFVQSGGIVIGDGRQDVLKLETAAESLKQMKAAAIQLTEREARLGPAVVASAIRLSDKKFVSGNLASSPQVELRETVAQGPFLIGSLSDFGRSTSTAFEATLASAKEISEGLVEAASFRKLVSVLMFDGSEERARALAREVPGLAIIVYRSSSATPTGKPPREGNTALISAGEKGKNLLAIKIDKGQATEVESISLSPNFQPDPSVQRLYATYQRRVAEENLLDRMPREESIRYVGTKSCGSCHMAAHQVWEETRHAKALATLEKDGSDRDPDCVGCHVVALDRTSGFRSKTKTPELANVGCESCHGPGGHHVVSPTENPMGKVGEKSCLPCHTPNHSPGFDYSSYWPKIVHK